MERVPNTIKRNADVIHARLGQSYFEITASPDPEGAVQIKSPKGQIEIGILGPLNIVNIVRVKPASLGTVTRTLERTYHFEVRDNGIWLTVHDQKLSVGDLAKDVLDLIA